MKDLNAKETLSQISDNWFMEEPFLFNVLCTHQEGLAYEEYYTKLKYICPDNEITLSKNNKPPKHTQFDDYFEAAQKSELWENDEMISERINFEIEKAQKTKQWGSLSGNMIEEILASVKIPMDYRRILSQFRASLISQRRKLTRMKLNRRYGFDYMGSKFEPKTKLMVGVDVSGSISKEDLEHFYSIINQFLVTAWKV